MKKYFLFGVFVLAGIFVFASSAQAIVCNPANPDDLSRNCSENVICPSENNTTHTTYGCMTPAGCSAPAPTQCGTSNYTVQSINGVSVVPPQTGANTIVPVTIQTQTVAPITLAPLGSNNVNVVKSHAFCVPGTEFNTQPYGDGVTYTGCYNLDHQLINVCRGTETVGACAPQRIDPVAAAAAAVASGPGCKAVENSMGGAVDRATGLGYFYTVSCPGASGGSGSGSVGTGSGATGVARISPTVQQTIQQAQNTIFNSITSAINTAEGQFRANAGLPPLTGGSSAAGSGTGSSGSGSSSSTGSGSGTSGASACFSLDYDLSLGANGSFVINLTSVLVSEGLLSQTQGTFDQKVQSAVIAYQEKHASDILTPAGLTKGTGFVGVNTRNYINKHVAGCTPSKGDLTYDFDTAVIGGIPTATFRYLAVKTNAYGWVKWSEIEGYDALGNKIKPVTAYASGSNIDVNSKGILDVIDGNINTFWNSGGNRRMPYGPLLEIFSPWVVVDFGSVQTFSKIRLYNTGDGGGQNRVYVSSDMKNFSELWRFTSGGQGGKWQEYAFLPYSGDPSVALSVNGSTSVTVQEKGPLAYNWNIGNADIVEAQFTGGTDYPLTYVGSADLCDLRYHLRAILPLYSFMLNPILPAISDLDTGAGSQKVDDLTPTTECRVGRTYTYQIRATQSRTGKTTTASVNIKIPGNTKLTDLWQIVGALNSFDATHVTMNTVSVSAGTTQNIPVWMYGELTIGPEVVVSVDSTSPGVTAVYTTGSGENNQYVRQIGSLSVTTSSGTSFPAEIKLKSTFAGDTKYTTIRLNNN